MASLGLVFGSVSLLMALASMLLPVALLAALQVWLCRKSLRLGLIKRHIVFRLHDNGAIHILHFQQKSTHRGNCQNRNDG